VSLLILQDIFSQHPPALSVVPLHPESTCVFFELKELIKTVSHGGEKQCQLCRIPSCWHRKRWQWLVQMQRGACAPTQCEQHSPQQRGSCCWKPALPMVGTSGFSLPRQLLPSCTGHYMGWGWGFHPRSLQRIPGSASVGSEVWKMGRDGIS